MRRRIVLLAALAAVLSTVLFAVPLGFFATQYFLDDERDELVRVASGLAGSSAAEFSRGAVPASFRSPTEEIVAGIYDSRGTRVAGSGPALADSVVRRAAAGVVSDGDVAGDLVVAVPVVDGTRVIGVVRAASDYALVRTLIAETWAGMAGLAAAAVAVTWLLARQQGRRLAEPLEGLSRSAQRLGDGDFTVRTARSGIAEIDAVGAALDTTAGEIGDLVGRERAFSGYASHQLRTPLTGLRLGLEAALSAPPGEQHRALGSAIAATDRLEQTIVELLALARDTTVRGEPFDLAELVGRLSDEREEAVRAAGRTMTVLAEGDLPHSRTPVAAVRQVLAVLLDNAIAHGRGSITLTVRAAIGALAVDVADEGEFFADPATVFVRHDNADSGHGIGLPLARTLAVAEGGRLTLTSTTPTTLTLLLPTA